MTKRKKPIGFTIEKLSTKNDEVIIFNDQSINNPPGERFLPYKLPEELSDLPYKLFFPIFLKEGNRYTPIARHWVLTQIIHDSDEKNEGNNEGKDEDFFYAIVVTDKDKAQLIRRYDEAEFKQLCGAKGVKGRKKSVHVSTKNRQKAKKIGNVCPFCNGPLVRKIGDHDMTEIGFFAIGCDYLSNPAIRCQFTYVCDEHWFHEFEAGKRPTKKWIERVPDQWCPECNDDLYCLTLPTGRRVTVCRKYLINDSPQFSRQEFNSGIAARENLLMPKKLCEDIRDTSLLITHPKRPLGLAWLNELLKDPTLFDKMSGAGMVKAPEAYAEIIEYTAKFRTGTDEKLHKIDQQEIMRLNRIIIENHFPSAPKMYLSGLTICKYTSDL